MSGVLVRPAFFLGFSVSEPEAQHGDRRRRGEGEHGHQHIAARVANIVLLGATIPFLGIDYEKVQDSIREIFLRKGEAIVEMNLKALAAGKEIAEKLM